MIIYHGRFQPFHRGHEAALRYLLHNYDSPVVVGVIQPDPENILEGDDKHWPRFAPERNPFSYWTRYRFIAATFRQEYAEGRLVAIVPLPRPSVNLARAQVFLPPKPRQFVVLDKWGDEIEHWKKAKYLMNEEEVLEIPFAVIPQELRGLGGSLIRALMVVGNLGWRRLVPQAVADLIDQDDLLSIVQRALPLESAQAYLKGVMRQDALVAAAAKHFVLGLEAVSEPSRAREVVQKQRDKGAPSQEHALLLHLSDLHFGNGSATHRWDAQAVLDALLGDLQSMQDKVAARISAVVVSGDVAFSGEVEQYDLATEWLLRVTNSLGMSHTSVFVVPGNHDVDRTISQELASLHATARKELDPVMATPQRRRMLLAKLETFFGFASRFARPSIMPNWPSVATPYWAHELQAAPGGSIVLLGMNSCVTSDATDAPGTLYVGQEQLQRLTGACKVGAFCVLVSHHPSRWLGDASLAERYARKKCQLWLTGHVHEADFETAHSFAAGDSIKIGAAAAHGAPGERGHGYSLILLTPRTQGEKWRVRLYPRRWRPRQLDFVADNDFDLVEGTEYCEQSPQGGAGK